MGGTFLLFNSEMGSTFHHAKHYFDTTYHPLTHHGTVVNTSDSNTPFKLHCIWKANSHKSQVLAGRVHSYPVSLFSQQGWGVSSAGFWAALSSLAADTLYGPWMVGDRVINWCTAWYYTQTRVRAHAGFASRAIYPSCDACTHQTCSILCLICKLFNFFKSLVKMHINFPLLPTKFFSWLGCITVHFL